MLIVFYALISVAIVVMIIGLLIALRLRKVASGGTIGKTVKLLIALILLFCFAYGVALFMPMAPAEFSLILVGIVFFFGAIYVILVLGVINRLVGQVRETLEL